MLHAAQLKTGPGSWSASQPAGYQKTFYISSLYNYTSVAVLFASDCAKEGVISYWEWIMEKTKDKKKELNEF